MTLVRFTRIEHNDEAVCLYCDTIHDQWFEHKTRHPGSSKLYVECDCDKIKNDFKDAYLIPKPDHQVWMRKWIHCKTCNNSWFEEGGEDSTCQCAQQGA